MKIIILFILLPIMVCPSISFAVELNTRLNSDYRLDKDNSVGNSSKRIVSRKDTRILRPNVDIKRLSSKETYEITDDCSLSSADYGCASFGLFSTSMTDSYIGEYNVFTVVGTGIRLPEDQIESFDGIDD